ncbi:D-aminoacylase [Botrimarina sp.]|uniref:N-acyl-D-amino-acid deacylase family protein n=1 Tax=Botrimarina sp. TaxID=2795802 RepID=UPI0032EBC729
MPRPTRSAIAPTAALLAVLVVGAGTTPAEEAAIEADLVLVGGSVHDGSGAPARKGNVAIRGDRIVAVGDFAAPAGAEAIDCSGLVVAPGFIDLHNHSDLGGDKTDPESGETVSTRPIFGDQTGRSVCYLTQGCTTIVTGNCGGGAVDVGDYYTRLDAAPPGVNVAHLVPQGGVRGRVIGDTRRAPSPEELDQMRQIVRDGMRAGAWGMSTGLQYVPSAYADTDEIAALAAVVAEFGGIYASHIRDEGDTLVESVLEAIEIGRKSSAPVHVSHFKASKRRNWGKVRVAAAEIERARGEGLRVTADQYPYEASSTSVSAMLLPDEEREGDWRQRLQDPEQAARLRPVVQQALEARGKILIASYEPRPEWVGRTIREIAKAENRQPIDTAMDLLRGGSASAVNFGMDPRDVRWVMTQPWVATASDGGVKVDDGTKPHPRSYGTFPRKIGRFSIEEGVVPLEQAIHSATGLPAEILGMADRGRLREGSVADVVAFDPDEFRDHATYQAPFQESTGVRWVLVGGKVAIRDGQPADLAAGRALRKTATTAQ